MKPAPFNYIAPSRIAEALEALAEYGDESKPLAGGQSLGPLLNLRLATPSVLVDLGSISELTVAATVDEQAVIVPAMATQRSIETSTAVARACPLLSEALGHVAQRTIRNRGTVGGSVAHADPAAELPAVAVATDATCLVRGPGGTRAITARRFFHSYFTTSLEPEDLLVEVQFPRLSSRTGSAWLEFAPRRGDYAVVGVAALLEIGEDGTTSRVALAYSGIADVPFRDDALDTLIVGRVADDTAVREAAELAAVTCDPGSDLVGSGEYRRDLVRVLTARALSTAALRVSETR